MNQRPGSQCRHQRTEHGEHREQRAQGDDQRARLGRMGRREAVAGLAGLGVTGLAAALAACGSADSSGGPASESGTATGGGPVTAGGAVAPEASSGMPATPPSSASEPSPAPTSLVEGWSVEEMVGQLLMVGMDATGADAGTIGDLITTRHVGNVFLAGRSSAGTQAVRGIVESLTARVSPESTRSTPLLVATDQEGGNVQVLTGPGFSTIPKAREQGTWDAATLTASARTWGSELKAAGITMNLAPVADVVDLADPSSNAPIGAWGRQYGTDATTSAAGAMAVAQGLREAGVLPTFKHFPGLGRVSTNTDMSAGVTDSVTARSGDAAVGAFAQAIAGGAEAVMMSSAVYTQIDASAPAVFSSVVVTDMLRGDLGFTGLVITDDVAAAAQLRAWPPADRAVMAVRAGCDMVLAAADASVAPAMLDALVAQAQADPAFAAQVRTAAERVLTVKAVFATG